MNFYLGLLCATVLLLCSCGKPLQGTLHIKPGEHISLTDSSGKEIVLKEGAATLNVEDKGTFFSSSLELQTQGGQWKIKIPVRAYLSKTNFHLSAEDIHQSVGLEGNCDVKNLGSRIEEGTQSCTYTGYCYTCGPGFDGKMDCSFKMSSSCNGSEKVRREITDFEYRYKVQFTRGNTPVGEFRSDSWSEENSTVLEVLSSCS